VKFPASGHAQNKVKQPRANIREREQARNAPRQSEERIRSYFELGLMGVAITSPAKRYLEVNDELCRILGYERSELLQKTWAELTHPDDLAADVANFNRALAGETDSYWRDKRFIRKDGQVIDAAISVECVRRPDGSVDYLVTLLQDITKGKDAEERLRRVGAQLADAQRLAHISRWLSWGFLGIAFLVMAGTGVIIDALSGRADESRRLQRLLVQWQGDANELDALEWRTISKGKLEAGLSERLRKIRSEMEESFGKLRPLESRMPQLHEVTEKYGTYCKLVDEEFRLLAAGEIKAAEELDAAKVDPAFDALHEAVAETAHAFDKLASPTLSQVRAGTFAVLIAAAGFIATIFWQYDKRRRVGEVAAAEQRIMRQANDALEARVSARNVELALRKQVEEKLSQSLNLLRGITEGTTDAVFAKDREGRYLMINTAGARLMGKTPEEMIGLDDTQFFSEETRTKIIERDRAIIRTGGARMDEDVTTTLAGLSRVHLTTKGALHDSAGAIIGLFGVSRDITERKLAEEELQQVNEQLRDLSRRLFQVQDDERRHLARELHDEIGQALTAAKINVDSIESAEGGTQSLRLKETSTLLDSLLRQVRQISLDLHSSLLDDLGLAPALRSLLDQQARRAGLRAQFYAAEPLENIDPEIQTTGFRIAQEAITNVLRHAKAQSVGLHLQTEAGLLQLKIVDDGKGFDLAEIEGRAHEEASFGLMGMRERAALVGGRVRIISSPNEGTTIEISLPLHVSEERLPGATP
jgi:PAS domain S-box-containing protein